MEVYCDIITTRRGITKIIGSRAKGGNNTIVTVANSKKVIAVPTGIAMGFAIPHAIKQQK